MKKAALCQGLLLTMNAYHPGAFLFLLTPFRSLEVLLYFAQQAV